MDITAVVSIIGATDSFLLWLHFKFTQQFLKIGRHRIEAHHQHQLLVYCGEH